MSIKYVVPFELAIVTNTAQMRSLVMSHDRIIIFAPLISNWKRSYITQVRAPRRSQTFTFLLWSPVLCNEELWIDLLYSSLSTLFESHRKRYKQMILKMGKLQNVASVRLLFFACYREHLSLAETIKGNRLVCRFCTCQCMCGNFNATGLWE